MSSRLFEIDLLLALAPLLVVPLGLALFRWEDPQAENLRRLAARAAPYAAVGAGLSIVPRDAGYQDSVGSVLAALWVGVCMVIAVSAVADVARSRHRQAPLEHYLPVVGCILLALGAIWLVLFRAGVRPGDLPIEIVELTAIHFHYAGFGAPIIAAQAARWLRLLPGRWDRLAALAGLGMVVGFVLVAAGIAVSPVLEVQGTGLMALSLAALAAGTTLVAFKLPLVPRVLLLLSSASVWVAMALAVQYAIGLYTVTNQVSVLQMARTHGVLNALGFTFCGLLGWYVLSKKVIVRSTEPDATTAGNQVDPPDEAVAEEAEIREPDLVPREAEIREPDLVPREAEIREPDLVPEDPAEPDSV